MIHSLLDLNRSGNPPFDFDLYVLWRNGRIGLLEGLVVKSFYFVNVTKTDVKKTGTTGTHLSVVLRVFERRG